MRYPLDPTSPGAIAQGIVHHLAIMREVQPASDPINQHVLDRWSNACTPRENALAADIALLLDHASNGKNIKVIISELLDNLTV